MIVYAVVAAVLLVVETVLGLYLVVRALVEKWQEHRRFDGHGRKRVGL